MGSANKDRILRAAEKYVLQGKFASAVNEYLKILKTEQDDVILLNTVGDLLVRLGKNAEAITYFTRVADLYLSHGFILKAIATLKKVFNLGPDNLRVQENLANLYYKQGLYHDAASHYRAVAEKLFQTGKEREATEIYLKIFEFDKNDIAVLERLGHLQSVKGDKIAAANYLKLAGAAALKQRKSEHALALLQRSLDLNPRDLGVIDLLVPAAHATGKDELAKGILDNLSAMHPDDLHLQELWGKLAIHTGEFAEAEKILLNLHREHGYDATPLIELLEHYAEKRKMINFTSLAEALAEHLAGPDDLRKLGEVVQRATAQTPGQGSLLEILSRLHARRGDFDAAAAAQAEMMSHFVLKGDLKKAFLAADQLVQWSPENAEYLQQHRSLFEKAYPGKVYEPPTVQPVISSDEPGFDIGEISAEDLEQIQLAGADDISSDADLDTKGTRTPSKEEGSFEISLDDLSAEGMEKGWDTLLDESSEAGTDASTDISKKPPRADHKGAKSGAGETTDFEIPSEGLEQDWNAFLSEAATGDLEVSGESATKAEPKEISSEKVHELARDVPLGGAAGSVSDALQEADFYLKMGFQADARLILEKLSAEHPDAPEVKERLQELEGASVFKDEAAARAVSEVQPVPDQELKDLTLQIDEAVNALFDFDTSGAESSPDALKYQEGRPEAVKPAAGDEFQTHMDLGKAYREMGLIPDAIQEFHKAIELAKKGKGHRETPLCYSMLSNCYLEAGESEKAAHWAQLGLQLKGSKEYERKTLLYDLGRALEELGKKSEARELFRKIQQVSPNFRDVSDRLKQLGA